MNFPVFFLQSMVNHGPSETAMSRAWMMALTVPLLAGIAGTVLGCYALRDIRLAAGRLGGAMLATIAAGFVPAAFIVIATAAAVNELCESIVPPGRRRDEIWIPAGVLIGIWLSFLMMRRMHRHATGWTPPATARTPLSGTATASLILTILGGLFIFTYINRPDFVKVLGTLTPPQMVLVNLGILTAGLICGVIARAERAGKVCAWICGALFLFLVLAHA